MKWNIMAAAVIAIGLVVYLLSASAQTAGANGEVPAQAWLARLHAPACVEQTADQLKANRQRAEWASEVRRQQKAGNPGACRVTGAGSPNANGIYYRVGRDTTADYYCNEAGMVLAKLATAPVSSWAILAPPPDSGILYLGAAEASFPGGQWMVGPAGIGPAPHVTKR